MTKEKQTPLMNYGDARQLGIIYADWARENGLEQTPEGMLAFLSQNGLLSAKEARQFVRAKIAERNAKRKRWAVAKKGHYLTLGVYYDKGQALEAIRGREENYEVREVIG